MILTTMHCSAVRTAGEYRRCWDLRLEGSVDEFRCNPDPHWNCWTQRQLNGYAGDEGETWFGAGHGREVELGEDPLFLY